MATKFLPRTNEEIEAGITGQMHIERMVDKSLENLGMDHIDLYIYHMWDYRTPVYDILDGLNRVTKAGKVRYTGISNCFAWQLAKANALAEKKGFTRFISVQGHYNLLFREEEREMAPFCAEENIAMTPYSALAGGRLSKHPGETSKRLLEDSYAKSKYDATAQQDGVIISRVAQLAEKRGVTMTGNRTCLAFDKGDGSCCGRYQTASYGRGGKGGGTCFVGRRNRLSGGTLRAA